MSILLILIFMLVVFALIYFLQTKKTRRFRLLSAVLLCIFIAITYKGFFVRPYPQTMDFYREKAIEIVSLGRWYNSSQVGLIYIKDLQVVDNKHLRIYFRRIGSTREGVQGLRLFDTSGREYRLDSHGIQMGLLLSSGVASYKIVDGYGDDFYFENNGIRLELSK